MTIWNDFLGCEIRYINTPNFGRVRIAESGKGEGKDPLFLLHGIGGHLEAYAKNVKPLSSDFHVIAYDFLNCGFSEKQDTAFNPVTLSEQLAEIMDVLGYQRANISGESLGGWVAGTFAGMYPERVIKIQLNTTGGIEITSEKGEKDMVELVELMKKSAGTPTYESTLLRMKWLMHEHNHHLLDEELVGTRLSIYSHPDMEVANKSIGAFAASDHHAFDIPLEKISCPTMFLWTRDNPIHTLDAAELACSKVAGASLYVMDADSKHWPQFEAPDEFNRVTRSFFLS
ncbi:alpha/beta fold hydrolase [Hyphomonas atlantica]|nr:alpha/beta hydrolase [Hyphomonas atlantica]MAN66976.1 alpha/beta hydrolase [Hyphomonadaceae bacterium]MBA27668.1 alpha/beta hydrolase [Hyphomonadaceae bacterium]